MHRDQTLTFVMATLMLAACADLHPEEGERGPQGDVGPTGPQGPKGEKGPMGPSTPEREHYVVQAQGLLVNGTAIVEVLCEEGDRALSGSCQFGKEPTERVFGFFSGAILTESDDDTFSIGQRCVGFSENPEASYVKAQALCEVYE